ncbi:hypothetical protein VE00_05076 [Pseudogymnoascus sp. WSF 3629]|nr:hypothetical protein VE00_05076 [Pseudogymnoascus sp. WSF 3629]
MVKQSLFGVMYLLELMWIRYWIVFVGIVLANLFTFQVLDFYFSRYTPWEGRRPIPRAHYFWRLGMIARSGQSPESPGSGDLESPDLDRGAWEQLGSLETWDRQISQSPESPGSGDRGAWEQLGSLETWDRQISQSPESPGSGALTSPNPANLPSLPALETAGRL